MSSIMLHREHGVNPTICMCFWCGEEKNELALLGARYKGKAPMHMVVDYNPCPKCAYNMELGITVIEVTSKTTKNPEIQEGLRPTGLGAVLKPEAVARILHPQSMVDQVLHKRKCFIDTEAYQQIMGVSPKPAQQGITEGAEDGKS